MHNSPFQISFSIVALLCLYRGGHNPFEMNFFSQKLEKRFIAKNLLKMNENISTKTWLDVVHEWMDE